MTVTTTQTPALAALQPPGQARPARSRLGFALRIVRPLAVDLIGSLFFGAVYVATHNLLLATGLGMATAVAAIGWRLPDASRWLRCSGRAPHWSWRWAAWRSSPAIRAS
jgi:hypothetical protein